MQGARSAPPSTQFIARTARPRCLTVRSNVLLASTVPPYARKLPISIIATATTTPNTNASIRRFIPRGPRTPKNRTDSDENSNPQLGHFTRDASTIRCSGDFGEPTTSSCAIRG